MKKLLLSLTACLLALPAMAAPAEIFTVKFGSAGNVTGDKNSAYTGTQVYTGKTNTPVYDKSWTVENFNNNNNGWTDMIKCGSKSAAYTGSVATDFAFEEKITNITATVIVNANNVTSSNLYVSTDGKNWGSAVSSNTSISKTTTSISFDITAPAANLYYKIDFVCTKATSNGILSLKEIKYTGETGDPSLANPAVAFPAKAYTAMIGEPFNAPTATTAEGAPAVVYSSEDESVATVNAATGAVTLLKKGVTTIVAKTEANDKWNEGFASYTLTVKDPNAMYYTQVTDLAAIGDSAEVYIVCKEKSAVLGATFGSDAFGPRATVTFTEKGEIEENDSYALVKVSKVSDTLYTFQLLNGDKKNQYLTYTGSGNTLDLSTTAPTYGTLSIDKDGNAVISLGQGKDKDGVTKERELQFNASSPRFACYLGTQTAIQLYMIQAAAPTAPEAPAILVNGEKPTAETVAVEDGVISFGEVAEGVAIYYNVKLSNTEAGPGANDPANDNNVGEIEEAPARENAASVEKDGITYTLYTGAPVKLEEGSSVISYFARANGLDSEVKTLTVTSATGIEGVAVEEGAAVWYDLNGVRVAEPKRGLYIRVQGGKATKEVR